MFEYNFLCICFISINRLRRSYLFHILQNMCKIHKVEETLDLVNVEVWIRQRANSTMKKLAKF